MSENKVNCSVTIMPIIFNRRIGFIRRDKKDTFGGLLVAPGGKVEITDGALIGKVPYFSVEYAAVRELKEETGIQIHPNQLEFLCSLTLPDNGRVVISLFARLSPARLEMIGKDVPIIFLDGDEIRARDDFAPGMKEEALWLLDKVGRELPRIQS